MCPASDWVKYWSHTPGGQKGTVAHAAPRPAAPCRAAPCCSNSLAGSQAAIWIIMCLALVMYMCAKQPRIAITTAAREGGLV